MQKMPNILYVSINNRKMVCLLLMIILMLLCPLFLQQSYFTDCTTILIPCSCHPIHLSFSISYLWMSLTTISNFPNTSQWIAYFQYICLFESSRVVDWWLVIWSNTHAHTHTRHNNLIQKWNNLISMDGVMGIRRI